MIIPPLLSQFILAFILVTAINLIFKDAQSRRYFKNSLQSYDSTFIHIYDHQVYDSLTVEK